MTEKTYDIAVTGATGLVGETIVSILGARGFPVGTLCPLAEGVHQSGKVELKGKRLPILDLAGFDFSKVQIAFFCDGVGREVAREAARAGCVVIDCGGHFTGADDVPLVIAEINAESVAAWRNENIIAAPGGAATQMLLVLKPLYDAVGIDRVNAVAFQTVSGAGKDAVEELAKQTANLLNVKSIEPKVFPRQIAFNCLPQTGELLENGYTLEELKMLWETQKILADTGIKVNSTVVRVPVFFGDGLVLHVETREKLSADGARELLGGTRGLQLLEGREPGDYPTPVTDAADSETVCVGRIREDLSHPRGLDLWVVADNVRRGVALNSVQIAEILVKDYL